MTLSVLVDRTQSEAFKHKNLGPAVQRGGGSPMFGRCFAAALDCVHGIT